MTLRQEYKSETGLDAEETFQEAASAPIYECGFTEEYVEWLENKLITATHYLKASIGK